MIVDRMSSLREHLVRFVEILRGRGVRISVGEAMDALRAVAAAGFERAAIREALAATLIKDEADRSIFDEAFAAFFRAAGVKFGESRQGASYERCEGRGPGEAQSETRAIAAPTPARVSRSRPTPQAYDEQRPKLKASEAEHEPGDQNRQAAESKRESDAAHREGEAERAGIEAQRQARLRAAERKPFTQYSDLDYENAREALKPLIRRFRVRVGRRLRIARRGRIDFRRTIRASTQRGGAMIDLRFRSRRPRRADLLILADVSGSVRYSTTLMLELVAGAHQCFRRVRSFVYIDRLAEADFELGHLVMTPALDLYARSDFGRVLAELWHRREELLGRATVLVVLGDGRNNRRPPRADLLREIRRICRAAIWLNPEDPNRWGTGDSAIRLYEREVNTLLPARNLHELEAGLLRVA
jgi:uncharacterized protein with von Willebrand factor type A (vWA) domain